MFQIPQSELLDAMRASLRDLENVRTIRPDDPDLVRLKDTIRRQIKELESKESNPGTSANEEAYAGQRRIDFSRVPHCLVPTSASSIELVSS
jgi:hypothetical protein